MMSSTYGKGGSAKRSRYFINLCSKMGDKGEGGVKNLKKLETSLMDGPLVCGCFSSSNEREV